jgi:hypothetical protein
MLSHEKSMWTHMLGLPSLDAASLLASYVRKFMMWQEAMVLNSKVGTSNRLPLSRKFFFRVMKAPKGLSDSISNRVRSWLMDGRKYAASKDQGREDTAETGSAVPISIIDDLIRKDYMESEMSQTHTIYLLNPKRVKMSDVSSEKDKPKEDAGAQKPVFKEKEDGSERPAEDLVLKYWYTTSKKEDQDKGFTCGTTMWAGTERSEAKHMLYRAGIYEIMLRQVL